MSRNGKHLQVRCHVCCQEMRSNNLKRHLKRHKGLNSLDDGEVLQELQTRQELHIQREERRQEVCELVRPEGIPVERCLEMEVSDSLPPPINVVLLESELLASNKIYTDKVEKGKNIATILSRGTGSEDSLDKEMKAALDLYRKQIPRMDIGTVVLRKWQADLIESMRPSTRQIIWVVGRKGNEGKSWFQGYLETLYGYARVVRLDVCNKTSNIFHALSRRPLATTDIFLFNESRSHGTQNYTALESIKDGCAIASKYGSQVLNFKIPNIVVVFSNQHPRMFQMSTDRWRVCTITKYGLKWMDAYEEKRTTCNPIKR